MFSIVCDDENEKEIADKKCNNNAVEKCKYEIFMLIVMTNYSLDKQKYAFVLYDVTSYCQTIYIQQK